MQSDFRCYDGGWSTGHHLVRFVMRAFYFPVVTSMALLLMHADALRAQRLGGVQISASPRGDSSRLSPTEAFSSQQSLSGDRMRNPGAQSAINPLGDGVQGGRREQGFVGRDAEDVRNTFRNLNPRQSRRAMFDLMIENLNDMRESRRRRQNRQAPPLPVRLPYRAAFDFPEMAPTAVADRLQTRFQKGIQEGAIGPMPQIELVGRKATIRGVARSEHQRRLIGQLVALEPGVSQVENLMEVAAR